MSVVMVVFPSETNCTSLDTSRMVLNGPTNQGVPRGTRAAEMQAQQYDEQPEGLESRMAALDSVRRPNPSIQVRRSTTKVGIALGISNLLCPRFRFGS